MHNFTKALLTAGLVALGSQAAQAQQLLDNFENTRLVDYSPATSVTVAANPGSNTVNSSASCGNYLRDGSQYATVNAIVKNNGKFANVSAYVAGTKRLSLKLRSAAPVGTPVQLVLQNRAKATATPYNYPQGNFSGVFNATTTVSGAWETLTFTYAGAQSDATVTANDIDQIAMLFAIGSTSPTTSAISYYIDDLTGPELVTLATRQAQTSTAALDSPYPNPAAGTAHLPFSLKQAATVSLAVYDQLGRRVAQVLEGKAYPAGEQSADIQTSNLASGLYTCRLVVDGAVLSRPLSVE